MVNTSTNTVVATVSVGQTPTYGNPHGVAVNPTGSRVYVAGSNGVSVIDASTNSVITSIPIAGGVSELVVNPGGTRVYANGYGVSVIDASANSVIASIPVSASAVAINSAESRVYVTNNSGVSIIDTRTNSVVATVRMAGGAFSLTVNPTGSSVYVINTNPPFNTILVIDTTTNDVIASIPVGVDSDDIAMGGCAGTFFDVPISYWASNYINEIYEVGITHGCGNGDYCPSEDVTRDQMAAFLVRATQVSAGAAPEGFTCNGNIDCSTTTPYLSDVPSTNGFFKYIQKLKELGITTGCGNGDYCPSEDVTRDQTAAFLVRATQVSAGAAPEGFTCNGNIDCSTTTPYFSDVPSTNGFFKYIQKLKELGITTGCGNGDYCPSEYGTRDQMATFLSRVFLGLH